MTSRTLTLGLALLGLAACEPSERAGGGASAPVSPPASSPAPPAGGRVISDEARGAMKGILAGESTGKKAWILSQPGDPEVTALVASLSAILKEAGWEVGAETAAGISLKPGVMTLVAEEQYPSYVDAVLRALDGAGVDAKSAAGYRGYFEAKKKENPSWPGIPMRADQDFVIVVGPKPAA